MRINVLLIMMLSCLYALGMGIGSARQLNGNIYVLSVFISTSEWDKNEKVVISQKLKLAQEWLTKEAKRYGKDVSFTNGYFGSEKTIIVDSIPAATGSGRESVDIVYETMQLIGWNNPLKFEDWVKNNTNCDQALVLIFANGKGRGYAMGYTEGYVKTHLEGAILFKSYLEGWDLYPSSIAHEMLHLFGAWDLYETFAQSLENSEKAEKLYPNDIMHKIKYNLNDQNIGEVTAWRIGLLPHNDKFDSFRPNSKK